MFAACRSPPATSADAVLSTERLSFPFETDSPFLFAVYHLDKYPPGNEKMGPDASLRGHNMGADFGHASGWNMYHGESIPGFPKHPHRGFETITVTRQGVIDHTDSLGNAGRFGNGDVQWMTAGAGINHAEMFPCLNREAENMLELFQVWINLPKRTKMAKPSFKMLWAEDLPVVDVPSKEGAPKTEAVLVAGTLPGVQPPPSPPPDSYALEDASDVMVLTLKVPPGSSFTLPAYAGPRDIKGLARNLYFYAGSTAILNGQKVTFGSGKRIKLRPDAELEIVAEGQKPAEFLVLQGRDIGEPVVQHGPFVGNTREDIQKAMIDYQRTGFGGWPWPSDALAHDRNRQRFAKYADGSLEEKPM